MSAATASMTDVSRTDPSSKHDHLGRNISALSQAQCMPMPLPALGTQRIIQGNGTNVGTVISLQCPAKHKLIGSDLTCVLGPNSTHWVGETYCKPFAPYEDYGFRVAVLASVVSSAIILLMSMAFITCCLLDCIKEDKRKGRERDSDMWQWEEQVQSQEDNRSRYSHKGRNNNNNNTQEKLLSLWDSSNPALCDSMRQCRCHQQYTYAPACSYGPSPSLAVLPGHDYNQPLLHPTLDSGPPPYLGPPRPSGQRTGLIPASAGASGVWVYGGQQRSWAEVKSSTRNEPNARNIYSNRNPKDFPIRIISV